MGVTLAEVAGQDLLSQSRMAEGLRRFLEEIGPKSQEMDVLRVFIAHMDEASEHLQETTVAVIRPSSTPDESYDYFTAASEPPQALLTGDVPVQSRETGPPREQFTRTWVHIRESASL